jgi:hypothetical protein
MTSNHLRSNVVGYAALFVALSGTAIALPGQETVFSDDIVDGQVRTNDISDSNGVRSIDVRRRHARRRRARTRRPRPR